ncbi:MAG: response regulator [Candidatus Dadabacteria bacterium]|nr:MAG: response regulator [Candidatus Dadabacteria bacterium]
MAYNLLAIDDSSIVRKSLRKTLAMTDIEVNELYEAENGKKGLEILREQWIDLVFLDINMPVMNGMEFMEELRKDEQLKGTPVVVVSTEGSKERRETLERFDIKAYLRKPVTPEALVETVNKVLGG